jgi:DNA-directed RNA polymerase specialized sigma24 family protein
MGRSVDDLLREQDWAKVSARVLAYALSRTRSRAKASDVAQEAMMRALDARWNPWELHEAIVADHPRALHGEHQ